MEKTEHAVVESAEEGQGTMQERPTGPFFVAREGILLTRRFEDFNSAYRYGLNRFGSEDFLVWREGW